MTTLVIAHRGNSSAAPENTFASFESALALGATLIECDVQMTGDGQLVVIHDVTLDRTSDRTGDLRQLSLAEVQAADVSYPRHFGSKFRPQRVPTLGELLSLLKGRARVMLEIKKESSQAGGDDFERRLGAEIVRSGFPFSPDMRSDLAIISFSIPILERMAAIIPEVPRGGLFYRASEEDMMAAAERAGVSLVMPEKSDLSAGLIERLQHHGLEVATWVCDDSEEFRELSTLGLIGIATNRPGDMIAAQSLVGATVPSA